MSFNLITLIQFFHLTVSIQEFLNISLLICKIWMLKEFNVIHLILQLLIPKINHMFLQLILQDKIYLLVLAASPSLTPLHQIISINNILKKVMLHQRKINITIIMEIKRNYDCLNNL
jgi:hypothetical protein